MKHNASKQSQVELAATRGALICLKKARKPASDLAIVVSNNIQNEASEFLIVVPLERRRSRLKAPFAVDLGRSDGLRELHTARCDWLTNVSKHDIKRIERAQLSVRVREQIDTALQQTLSLNMSPRWASKAET